MPPRRICRVESNGTIHFAVTLLVVTPQAKTSIFLRFSRFYKLSSPPIDTSPSTVRTLWKTISEPFKHAESDGSLNLLLRLLVAELQAKTFQFHLQKISRKLSSPPIHTSPAIVGTPWKSISGHLWCAESSCPLSLTLWPLVVALRAKVFKIFRFSKFRQPVFTLSKEHHHL